MARIRYIEIEMTTEYLLSQNTYSDTFNFIWFILLFTRMQLQLVGNTQYTLLVPESLLVVIDHTDNCTNSLSLTDNQIQ